MVEQVQEKLVYDVKEAAAVLGISHILAYDLVRQGKIPSIRISSRRILIPKAALATLLGLTTK